MSAPTSRRYWGRTRSAGSSSCFLSGTATASRRSLTSSHCDLLVVYGSSGLQERRQLVGEEAQQQRDEVEVLSLFARDGYQ